MSPRSARSSSTSATTGSRDRLGDLPLSAQQQAWFTDNLGSGNVPSHLEQLDPGTADQGRARLLRDTFVHSLSSSLKLSTAVAVAGVVIARPDAGRRPGPCPRERLTGVSRRSPAA